LLRDSGERFEPKSAGQDWRTPSTIHHVACSVHQYEAACFGTQMLADEYMWDHISTTEAHLDLLSESKGFAMAHGPRQSRKLGRKQCSEGSTHASTTAGWKGNSKGQPWGGRKLCLQVTIVVNCAHHGR